MAFFRTRQVSPAPRHVRIAPWQQVLALLICVVLNGATVSSAHTSAAAPLAQAFTERLNLATGHDHLRTALAEHQQGSRDQADNSPDPSSPDAITAASQLPVALATSSPRQTPATTAVLQSRPYRLAIARAPPLA